MAPLSREFTHPEDFRLDVQLSSEKLLKAVETLQNLDCWYLSAITGLDNMKPVLADTQPVKPAEGEPAAPEDDSFEALYHFCCHAAVVTLRVKVPRASPSIPSICSLIPSASLYEREAMDMFGFEIVGTPNTDRLLLSDDWPKGVYPLRKDFTGLPKKVAGQKGQ